MPLCSGCCEKIKELKKKCDNLEQVEKYLKLKDQENVTIQTLNEKFKELSDNDKGIVNKIIAIEESDKRNNH